MSDFNYVMSQKNKTMETVRGSLVVRDYTRKDKQSRDEFFDFDTVLYKTVHFIIGLSIPIDCTDVKSQLIGKDPDAGKN